MKPGHILVDLDGTLAQHIGTVSVIGPPIPRMVERVKRWLADGEDVRIFTARVSGVDNGYQLQRAIIEEWCEKHIGRALPITCRKDYATREIWDDIAVGVAPNGERRDGFEDAPSGIVAVTGHYRCEKGAPE